MKPIKRILATTDFSSLGNAAVERALMLAARENAEILAIHAFPEAGLLNTILGPGNALKERMRTAAQESLDDLVRRGGTQARAKLLDGTPADVFATAAADFQPDLIVIGAHARGAIRQFFLGGTASRILERAACPVLVVRQPTRADYTRALATVDLGSGSANVVVHALAMARHGRVTVAHAYQPPFDAKLHYRAVSNEDVEQLMASAAATAQARMSALLSAPELAGANLETRVIRGHPNPVLLELATELDIDIIVAARHKGSPIEEAVMGSISRLLAYHAPCDVLVA